MSRKIHPLIVLIVLVVMSLLVATVLFKFLSSTGIVKSRYVEFGGAAAGFFATLYLLQRCYERWEKIHVQDLELNEEYVRDSAQLATLMEEKRILNAELEIRKSKLEELESKLKEYESLETKIYGILPSSEWMSMSAIERHVGYIATPDILCALGNLMREGKIECEREDYYRRKGGNV